MTCRPGHAHAFEVSAETHERRAQRAHALACVEADQSTTRARSSAELLFETDCVSRTSIQFAARSGDRFPLQPRGLRGSVGLTGGQELRQQRQTRAREQLRERARIDRAAALDERNLRRQATALVVRGDVERQAIRGVARARGIRQLRAADVRRRHAMTVRDEMAVGPRIARERLKRRVVAVRGDGIGLGEQRSRGSVVVATETHDLQPLADLGIGVVQRPLERARQHVVRARGFGDHVGTGQQR